MNNIGLRDASASKNVSIQKMPQIQKHSQIKEMSQIQKLSQIQKTSQCGPECDVPVPGIPVPGNSSFFLMVSEPELKKFGTEKNLGTGIEKIWYRKKSRNQNRKFLVPK